MTPFELNNTLIKSTQANRINHVQHFIEKGADINAGNWLGLNSLHYACELDYQDIVELLLEKGANTNQPNIAGGTAMSLAVSKGYTHLVELLIAHGADINAEDNNGDTVLTVAFKHGKTSTADFLLKNGADINYQNKNGDTTFMKLIKDNKLNFIKQLLHYHVNGEMEATISADIHLENKLGKTAFFYALENGNRDVVKLLLESSDEINHRDKSGQTAVFDLINSQNIKSNIIKADILEILVKENIDLDIQDNEGNSLIMNMLGDRHGKFNPELIMAVLGKNVNLLFVNNDGMSVIDIAKNNIKVKNTNILSKLEMLYEQQSLVNVIDEGNQVDMPSLDF